MNGTQCASNGEYVPPKDWSALNADEKIERMRDIIKGLQNSLGYQQTQTHKLRLKLSRHEHENGKVIEKKEIKDYDDEGGLCGVASSLNSDKYF